MSHYQKILVTVDLNPAHDNQVLKQAKALAATNLNSLYVAHAVEPMTSYGTASAFYAIADIENEITQEHKAAIAKIVKEHNLSDSHIYVVTGSPSTAIPELASEVSADLIVVGSHEHHGLAALLSSTADSLLHHAPCDVLAVKLKDC